MKLYDIRAALKNLVQINKELDKEKLTSLLHAAGWEEQDIKDALLLWETHSYDDAPTSNHNVDIILNEDMHPSKEILDTTTTLFAETSVSKDVQNKDDIQNKQVETNTEVQVDVVREESHIEVMSTVVTPEPSTPTQGTSPEDSKTFFVTPESAFYHVSKKTTPEELPHNLPLRPYESSHVTVPLNEYQKRFVSHVKTRVDTMHTTHETSTSLASVVSNSPASTPAVLPPLQSTPIIIGKVIEAPFETQDKYLVFIASTLFILVMFILGYMHLSGRL